MDHLPELILALMALAIFIAVAWYIIGKIRKAGNEIKSPSAQELLARFGQMYDAGELSTEEFRAIKLTFASTFAESSSSSDSDKDTEQARREARLRELLHSERR
ncbi:MAG: hypothetical protein ACOX0A_07430 [Thermoguttaceae bacterium]|jgi:hypothetical protein